MNEEIGRAEEALAYLKNRQAAYHGVFITPSGDKVLEDLAKFCRAHESTFHADERMSAVLEGRREVWLRIQHHLQLSDVDIWKLYGEGGK